MSFQNSAEKSKNKLWKTSESGRLSLTKPGLEISGKEVRRRMTPHARTIRIRSGCIRLLVARRIKTSRLVRGIHDQGMQHPAVSFGASSGLFNRLDLERYAFFFLFPLLVFECSLLSQHLICLHLSVMQLTIYIPCCMVKTYACLCAVCMLCVRLDVIWCYVGCKYMPDLYVYTTAVP